MKRIQGNKSTKQKGFSIYELRVKLAIIMRMTRWKHRQKLMKKNDRVNDVLKPLNQK